MKLLSILTSSLLLITNIAEAKTIKRYSLKSAIIKYEISGNGKMMGVDTNSSGTKSLYFKNYGDISIEKLDQTITQFGDIPDERRIHTLKKIDNITVYSVDFKKKKIIKSIDPIAYRYQELEQSVSDDSISLLIEHGGRKIGTDKVLGFKCEIWSIMGISQCLYKNQIPLWIEADIMGMKQKIIALDIKLNVNIHDKEFELPKYSIEILTTQTSAKTTNKNNTKKQ